METIEEAFENTLRILRDGDCCSFIEYNSKYIGDNVDYINLPQRLKVYFVNDTGTKECLYDGNISSTYNYFLGNIISDGTYLFVVELRYLLVGAVEEIVLTKELEICLDCCLTKRKELTDIIKGKMSFISCKIQDYKAIGKRVFDLEKNYLKLSKILYLLDDKNCRGFIDLSCEDVNKIDCLIKKIK